MPWILPTSLAVSASLVSMGHLRLPATPLIVSLLGLVCFGCANAPPAVVPTPAPSAAEGAHPTATEGEHPTFAASDLVLAIDNSTLGLLASGVDVNADGHVGRTRSTVYETSRTTPFPTRSFTTDPGDTVHALQIRVARALVPALAARETRLGLASFSIRDRGITHARLNDRPTVSVPVGAAEPVLAALGSFPAAHDRRHTDLARLLELAAKLLDGAERDPDPTRTRAILLLSHGQPSAPDGIHWASQRALAVARELGKRGISVWAIPFGIANVAYLEQLTQVSGGSVVPLGQLHARFGPVSR